jgi:hypothetical protein
MLLTKESGIRTIMFVDAVGNRTPPENPQTP